MAAGAGDVERDAQGCRASPRRARGPDDRRHQRGRAWASSRPRARPRATATSLGRVNAAWARGGRARRARRRWPRAALADSDVAPTRSVAASPRRSSRCDLRRGGSAARGAPARAAQAAGQPRAPRGARRVDGRRHRRARARSCDRWSSSPPPTTASPPRASVPTRRRSPARCSRRSLGGGSAIAVLAAQRRRRPARRRRRRRAPPPAARSRVMRIGPRDRRPTSPASRRSTRGRAAPRRSRPAARSPRDAAARGRQRRSSAATWASPTRRPSTCLAALADRPHPRPALRPRAPASTTPALARKRDGRRARRSRLHGPHIDGPLEALRRLGGGELAVLCGLALGAGEHGLGFVCDGLHRHRRRAVAVARRPGARARGCSPGHRSPEPAHARAARRTSASSRCSTSGCGSARPAARPPRSPSCGSPARCTRGWRRSPRPASSGRGHDRACTSRSAFLTRLPRTPRRPPDADGALARGAVWFPARRPRRRRGDGRHRARSPTSRSTPAPADRPRARSPRSLVTGGLHEDGLADSRRRDRRARQPRAAPRDPPRPARRHLRRARARLRRPARVATLLAGLDAERFLRAAIAGHVLGRWSTLAALALPPARRDAPARARSCARAARPTSQATAFAGAALVLAGAGPGRGLVALAPPRAVAHSAARAHPRARRRHRATSSARSTSSSSCRPTRRSPRRVRLAAWKPPSRPRSRWHADAEGVETYVAPRSSGRRTFGGDDLFDGQGVGRVWERHLLPGGRPTQLSGGCEDRERVRRHQLPLSGPSYPR